MSVAAHSMTPLYTDWRDRYQLIGKIGSGGFADVYEALDLTLDQRVALKVVAEGRGMSGRLVREGKPQNVMLECDGHGKVMDFCSARLMDADTLAGDCDVIGTVAYMSPE